jgi:hypothetical protein
MIRRIQRFRTEQSLVFLIKQLGCDTLSGHSVRTVGTQHAGCSSFNGREAGRSLPLRPNARRDAAEMRRRFRCEEIAAHLREPMGSPVSRRAGLSYRDPDGG